MKKKIEMLLRDNERMRNELRNKREKSVNYTSGSSFAMNNSRNNINSYNIPLS